MNILLDDEAEHRFRWEMEKAERLAVECEDKGDHKSAEEWLRAAIWYEAKLLALLEERQRVLWDANE